MARLIPDDIDDSLIDALGHHGEHRTLLQLRDGLTDEYVVYHSIHWANSNTTESVYGEIDFIIANRYGKLLAIEQKDGVVYVDADDIKVDYTWSSGKSVTTQINRNLNGLRNAFAKRYPTKHLLVDHLLYVPNALIRGQLPASVDPDRVIDADTADHLCAKIESIFDASPMTTGDAIADASEIHQFLSDRVQAVPHIGLLGQSTKEYTTRLSGGLATWASRFKVSPYRLQVRGTAGSGKTQLALHELRQAAANGVLAIYLCFNRPLADAIKQAAPDSSVVMTVHEFGRELAVNAKWTIDFADPTVYSTMIEAIHALIPKVAPLCDVLVIDEAQDMPREWIESLIKLAAPMGRIIILDDPAQALYGHELFQATDWPVLESPVNYRSPRSLVTLMNTLRLTDTPIQAGSSVQGFDPHWQTYSDEGSLVDATEQVLKKLLHDGFRPENIAIISFQSSKQSVFLRNDNLRGLAGLALKRSQGYDENSQPVYSDGKVLVESLKRFKGQAADAVIITEIDFETLDTENRNKLFVALSRARLQVAIVVSEQANDILMREFDTYD